MTTANDSLTRRFHSMLDQATAALEADGSRTPYAPATAAIELIYGEMRACVGFRAHYHGVDECDLLSEVGEKAVKLVRAMVVGRVARPESLTAFASAVVKLTALTLVRSRVARARMQDLLDAEAAVLGCARAGAGFETALFTKDLYDACMARLSDEARLVAIGRELGLSDAEIGEILGIKANAVQQRRFNIRRDLRDVRDGLEGV